MTRSAERRGAVLIVGAGPTGLVLALTLARRGVRLRIVDKEPGPGEASRAMAVQARTLEFYAQLGIAEEVIADGVVMRRIHLRRGGREFGRLPISEIGDGLSLFPFVLCYPQDDHERLLVEKLREAGVEVEWNVELTGLEQTPDRVRATLRSPSGEETCDVEYLCGCDGAHSAVRRALGIEFPGGDYDDLFYVADVKIASGFDADGYANVSRDAFALMLPVRSSGMQRLIGIVPRELAGRHDLTYEDIRDQVEPLVGAHATQVNWFATYRVHHRVAERFRSGRCFLAGDAAHIHSPAGGQGMNTGIGDAFNLAWKLAEVLRGRASASILETYEAERLPFARRLVATTDRAFQWISGRGFNSWAFRTAFLPTIVPLATRFSSVRRLLFRTVSQILIAYPQSPLSSGRAGAVAGGDRLPWVSGDAGDNFAFLRSLDWQVHVYGVVAPSFREDLSALGLAVHEIPWNERAATAGLRRDAAYLVRPDGYIAVASRDQDARPFLDFAERFQLRFEVEGD
jgi:2-polyprenyl-6-methoxyphenol hydroxylase-like FAD-dependent oxidoreductase